MKAKNTTKFYVIYGGSPLFSVADSELTSFVRRMAKYDYDLKIVFLLGIRPWLKERAACREKIKTLRNYTDSKILVVPIPKPSLRFGLWYGCLVVGAMVLKDILLNNSRVLIYAFYNIGGYIAARVSQAFPYVTSIYSMRSVGSAEYIYQSNLRSRDSSNTLERFNMLERHEAVSVRGCHGLLLVSENMRNYVLSKYGIPKEKTQVVPLAVDAEKFPYSEHMRDLARHRLGLENKIVWIYVGSMHKWQQFDKMVELFLRTKKSGKKVHFLVLTHDQIPAKKILSKELGSDDYTLMTAPHDEVGYYLRAADLGLLLREDHLLNRVASPTKFGEYLLSGVPVVVTQFVGDFSKAVETNDLGIVVNLDDVDESSKLLQQFTETLSAEGSRMRQRCHDYAMAHLTWEANIDKIIASCEKAMTNNK